MASAEKRLLSPSSKLQHRSAHAGDHGVLRFWRSESEARAPGIVEEQHCQAALLFVVVRREVARCE